MALVTAAMEPNLTITAFADKMVRLNISARQRLDDVGKTVSGLPFGRTDCALPMLWALDNGVKADAFVIYTDSETWYGNIHPVQALQEYRQKTGIRAKLIVVGIVSNQFTIADPNDAGMLDVVGFDTAVPQVMNDFIIG
jgi:60 kDa SS-A/Ro ribonucleoprotein